MNKITLNQTEECTIRYLYCTENSYKKTYLKIRDKAKYNLYLLKKEKI